MLSQARIIAKKFVRNHVTSSCAASEKSIFKMNYHLEKAKKNKQKVKKIELSDEYLESFVFCDNVTKNKSDNKKEEKYDDFIY